MDISKFFSISRAPVPFIYCLFSFIVFTWQRSGPGDLKKNRGPGCFFSFFFVGKLFLFIFV